jgi:hypothetical protein
MKNLLILVMMIVTFSACTATRDVTASRQDQKRTSKLERQLSIRKAVESRQYIIKLDRIYLSQGGFADLISSNNFLIVNGEIASVSLGYVGRSYFSRPISGINFNGQTVNYSMTNNETRGTYKIYLQVKKDNDVFDFYIDVGTGGSCRLSVINPRIQSVSYSGNIVPMPEAPKQVSERPVIF